MEFNQCTVSSVHADIANGIIKLTFKLSLNDENIDTAYSLGQYVDKDHGKVSLQIIPNVPPLIDIKKG